MEENKDTLSDKEKRKEVARRRTFWFLVIFNLLLMVYIFIQVILISRG